MTTEIRMYALTSPYLTLNDRASQRRVRFQIEQQEYFSSLAETLGFVEEKLATIKDEGRSWYAVSQEIERLQQVREDLAYLITHYDITPKEKQSFWEYLN